MDFVLAKEVRAVQASMLGTAGSNFSEPRLDDLRGLIRLTVQFFHHLQGDAVEDDLRYLCDSVFSGVDSFVSVSNVYRMLPGARETTLSRDPKSIDSLKDEFVSKYPEFHDGTDFEKRCRILLDLFILQIVFAALSYY